MLKIKYYLKNGIIKKQIQNTSPGPNTNVRLLKCASSCVTDTIVKH